MICSEVKSSLGIYILGAIEPAERSWVEEHLSVCPHCRDELADLAGLPALLGRVNEEQILQVSPPSRELLDATLARAAGHRRAARRRNRLWLAVAAAVMVIMVGLGGLAGRSLSGSGAASTPPPGAIPTPSIGPSMFASDPATHVSAQIAVQAKQWGTAFAVRLHGAPAGERCRLIAVAKDGERDPAGSWQVEYEGYVDFYGSSMIHRHQLKAVEIRTLDGRHLLSVTM